MKLFSLFGNKEVESKGKVVETDLFNSITVHYEVNDEVFGPDKNVKEFHSWSSLENWIFDKMDLSRACKYKFPEAIDENGKADFKFPIPWTSMNILMIQNRRGTLFSDGSCTDDEVFISKKVSDFCKCLNNSVANLNNFVEE